MIRVKEVKPLDGYKLLITFTNQEVKIFDMKDRLEQKVFSPLKDISLFRRVKIEFGTTVWNDEIDYCPDCLYEESVSALK